MRKIVTPPKTVISLAVLLALLAACFCSDGRQVWTVWIGSHGSLLEGPVSVEWGARHEHADREEAGGLEFEGFADGYYGSRPLAMVCDPLGFVYVAFRFGVLKYDSGGHRVWRVPADDPPGPGQSHNVADVAVDGTGNFYITGTKWMPQHPRCHEDSVIFVAKYDIDGNQVWEVTFDGPNQHETAGCAAGGGRDMGTAVAVDDAGSVYVTGHVEGGEGSGGPCLFDYVTLKYDGDGNRLWQAYYDGPAGQTDRAVALALDAGGNPCVTGSSRVDDHQSNYATVKYDGATGDLLWVARYAGPANLDKAKAMVIDNDGHIYVTGSSGSGLSADDSDYATVKYDSGGNQLWVARYDGSGGGFDHATALAIDGLGNCIVTGQSEDDSAAGCSYATIKYDAAGHELWSIRFEGYGFPEHFLSEGEEPPVVAVDDSGNVYLAGGGLNGLSESLSYECVTTKYASDGAWVWTARYRDPEGRQSSGHCVTVDGSGIVFIAACVWGDVVDSAGTNSQTVRSLVTLGYSSL